MKLTPLGVIAGSPWRKPWDVFASKPLAPDGAAARFLRLPNAKPVAFTGIPTMDFDSRMSRFGDSHGSSSATVAIAKTAHSRTLTVHDVHPSTRSDHGR